MKVPPPKKTTLKEEPLLTYPEKVACHLEKELAASSHFHCKKHLGNGGWRDGVQERKIGVGARRGGERRQKERRLRGTESE